jgi:hypothetical protein
MPEKAVYPRSKRLGAGPRGCRAAQAWRTTVDEPPGSAVDRWAASRCCPQDLGGVDRSDVAVFILPGGTAGNALPSNRSSKGSSRASTPEVPSPPSAGLRWPSRESGSCAAGGIRATASVLRSHVPEYADGPVCGRPGSPRWAHHRERRGDVGFARELFEARCAEQRPEGVAALSRRQTPRAAASGERGVRAPRSVGAPLDESRGLVYLRLRSTATWSPVRMEVAGPIVNDGLATADRDDRTPVGAEGLIRRASVRRCSQVHEQPAHLRS